MSAFIAWLFSTKLGRTLLLVSVILLCWWAFSSHYDGIGYARCQNEHAAAQATADRKQAEENTRRNETSSVISNDTSTATQTVIAESEDEAEADKGKIHDTYREPPKTAPLLRNSCVHPVDPSVQDSIDEAIRRANET